MSNSKKPINEIDIFSDLSNTARQIISELLEHNEKLQSESQQLRDRLQELEQKHFVSEYKTQLKLTNRQRNIFHLYSQFQYRLKSPKLKHWSTLIGKFLVSQGSIQIFNLLTGFFLLRWMTVENYAQFSVAFGFQTTFNMLIDTGFSGSIVALVGDRFQDKSVVGKYIKSAQQFRNRSFAVIIPIAGIAFHLICTKRNWSWGEQILLFGAITASLFFQGWASYYSPALLMHQQIAEYYKPQIVGSAVRLFFCYILYIISALSAWTNIWITTFTIAFNGISYRYSAANFIDKPEKNDPAVSKEMVGYISPLIPGLIFTAFQGQISLAVISIMGQAQNIAEVSALGRLGQLFVLLGAFNGIVIEPYIAKANRSDLPKRYFQILGISIFIASMICVMGFVFPQPLLWLLGSKYQKLRTEVGWVVAGACLSYVGGVMWSMHSARRWIYWWGTFAYIGIILITQVGCLILMDLSTTLGVIYFSLISTLAVMVIHVANATFGFRYGAKTTTK